MALNHGINTYQSETQTVSVTRAQVGIPMFVGAWPVHRGAGFKSGPVLVHNFSEAKELGGYSDEWRTSAGAPKWSLCQAAYGFLLHAAMSPAVFVNVFDPAKHKTAVAAASFPVTDHEVRLPADALDDSGLTVTVESDTLEKGTDYNAFYEDDALVLALASAGAHYAAASLTVAYNKADPAQITATEIEAAFEQVELCKTALNIVPDLFCAPGWSKNPAVAAVMAAKAPNINGLFRAMAVVDLDTAAAAADSYDKVMTYKSANGYTDENMIVCWPLVKVGDRLFDMSVIVCGAIARSDSGHDDLPYASASNSAISVSGLYNAAGAEIFLTVQQADVLSYSDGVVCALNFNGWVSWGNYTGCWPTVNDPAKCFYCTKRMQNYLCNTFVNTYWTYLDRPLTRVLIDAIVNDFNAYLDGLTNLGALYGGELQFVEDNNPATELLAGRFRLDLQAASPVPAQRIDLNSEFSVSMLTDALTA